MKKEQNVLERVYEPRRLLEAWRQVKSNAGAAGVDQMRARRVWVAMRSWQSANRREVLRVLNADWFRSLGLVFLQEYSAASTS